MKYEAFKNLEQVYHEQHRIDQQINQQYIYTSMEEASDTTMYTLIFDVPRKTTAQLQRILYKATYSNVMMETFPLDLEIDGNIMDLMAVYVTG